MGSTSRDPADGVFLLDLDAKETLDLGIAISMKGSIGSVLIVSCNFGAVQSSSAFRNPIRIARRSEKSMFEFRSVSILTQIPSGKI